MEQYNSMFKIPVDRVYYKQEETTYDYIIWCGNDYSNDGSMG